MKKNEYLIVRLFGGLGNQMFQYALGRALENAFGRKVLFDRQWFSLPDRCRADCSTVALRPLGLDCFPNIQMTFANSRQVQVAMGNSWSFLSKVKRRLNHSLHTSFVIPDAKDFVISQGNSFGAYRDEILAAPDSCGRFCYEGYWQNEAYFQEIESDIRHEFEFDLNLDDFNRKMLSRISGTAHSVALHVRCGDYATLGWTLPIAYYEKAILKMEEICGNCTYFVFGQLNDQIKELLSQHNCVFAGEHNSENKQDFRDMQLMAACENAIVANSSFSWWAAWLGKNKNQVVLAPSPWLNNEDSIIPQNWMKIFYHEL